MIVDSNLKRDTVTYSDTPTGEDDILERFHCYHSTFENSESLFYTLINFTFIS